MNVFKLIIVAISGLGIGFTTTQVINNDTSTDTENDIPLNGTYGCHFYDDFIDREWSMYSEEDQLLINGFVDQYLTEQEITWDELFDDFDLRYEFMDALHDFLYEQNIEPLYEDYRPSRRGHMGW